MRDGRGEAGDEWLGLELAPGTQVAGFFIEGRLARGSFGALYAARRGARRFAIKLVPRDERGEREVDALRRVQALPVVGFLGYGLWPDEAPRFLVLALELVDGPELDVWARDFNPDAHELLVQVMRPLVDILGRVHAAGVVHRDVKESNIIIRQGDGRPVLVDFGAAGFEGAPRLTQRMPPGTPEYRSPELLRFAREWVGEPPPERPGDDLWALGVTFYALLTRTLPFGDRQGPLVRRILEHDPEPPHVRNPRVPRVVSELCLRMLEKRPEARFADAPALAAALLDVLAQADDTWRTRLFPGERQLTARASEHPVSPAPPRARRWPVAVALGGLLALGGGLAARELTSEDGLPTPPRASAAPRPMQQAASRHELAPEHMTGEVGFNAGPRKSPTPAPVAPATHPTDPPMKLSATKRRALAPIAAACITSACASGPKPIGPPGVPPRSDCPKGSGSMHNVYDLPDGQFIDVSLGWPGKDPERFNHRRIPAKNGPIEARLYRDVGSMPEGTIFYGEMMLRVDFSYGKFTRAQLPDGKVIPVCLAYIESVEFNTKPGDKLPEGYMLYSAAEVRVVRPFIDFKLL
ncbi:serine/threonine protein kinase [Melittangium boletus]|uniref:serine/threonine protein kinase n=1 Tax=Melittangium boletus TaxID=83453 RepID=UPI003DA65592